MKQISREEAEFSAQDWAEDFPAEEEEVYFFLNDEKTVLYVLDNPNGTTGPGREMIPPIHDPLLAETPFGRSAQTPPDSPGEEER